MYRFQDQQHLGDHTHRRSRGLGYSSHSTPRWAGLAEETPQFSPDTVFQTMKLIVGKTSVSLVSVPPIETSYNILKFFVDFDSRSVLHNETRREFFPAAATVGCGELFWGCCHNAIQGVSLPNGD